jgi:hypothetical protein
VSEASEEIRRDNLQSRELNKVKKTAEIIKRVIEKINKTLFEVCERESNHSITNSLLLKIASASRNKS